MFTPYPRRSTPCNNNNSTTYNATDSGSLRSMLRGEFARQSRQKNSLSKLVLGLVGEKVVRFDCQLQFRLGE